MRTRENAPLLDPLRRVFLHNEPRFRTADGVYYHRVDSKSDTIRRQVPKVRGKSARRAEKYHKV